MLQQAQSRARATSSANAAPATPAGASRGTGQVGQVGRAEEARTLRNASGTPQPGPISRGRERDHDGHQGPFGKRSAAPTTADGRPVTYSPAWDDPGQREAARPNHQGAGSVALEASIRERPPLPTMTGKAEQTPASRRRRTPSVEDATTMLRPRRLDSELRGVQTTQNIHEPEDRGEVRPTMNRPTTPIDTSGAASKRPREHDPGRLGNDQNSAGMQVSTQMPVPPYQPRGRIMPTSGTTTPSREEVERRLHTAANQQVPSSAGRASRGTSRSRSTPIGEGRLCPHE